MAIVCVRELVVIDINLQVTQSTWTKGVLGVALGRSLAESLAGHQSAPHRGEVNVHQNVHTVAGAHGKTRVLWPNPIADLQRRRHQ